MSALRQRVELQLFRYAFDWTMPEDERAAVERFLDSLTRVAKVIHEAS